MSTQPLNLLLKSLSQDSRNLLLSRCVEVDLSLKKVLYEAESKPHYAYFLTSGIASVVTVMTDGATAEVGLIGREGMVGGLHLLGPAKVSTNCFVQLAGSALRMPFSDLVPVFRSNEEIRGRILEFEQEQAVSLGQLAGCHRLHEAEERLARWLLMAQDRTQSDVLDFTQEFLGMMLGARRSTVTIIAGVLQRSGLIEYNRGRVTILERERLEEAACDCYQIAKKLHANLYSRASPTAVDGHASRTSPASHNSGT